MLFSGEWILNWHNPECTCHEQHTHSACADCFLIFVVVLNSYDSMLFSRCRLKYSFASCNEPIIAFTSPPIYGITNKSETRAIYVCISPIPLKIINVRSQLICSLFTFYYRCQYLHAETQRTRTHAKCLICLFRISGLRLFSSIYLR